MLSGRINVEQAVKRSSTYERHRKLIGRIVLHVVVIGLAIIFMIPIYWMFSVSVKDPPAIGRYPIEFWPEEPVWDNYVEVWRRADVSRYMFNSVFLATLYTTLTVCSSSLVGYGFARFGRVWLKKHLFKVVLATMIMPPMVFIIPHFILFHRFGLLNTYWPWVLFGIGGSGFHIFLFRQFFSSFPQEIEDAARIDGCGPFQTFVRIILPNAKAALAAGAIFAFQWNWSNYLLPKLYLQQSKTTFAVALAVGLNPPFRPDYAPDYPVQMAGAFYFTVPLLLMFFLAQKYIIKGVVTSGLKG